MTRYLIVNADDFGQSSGVNRGVALAHERGIVTSASLMVVWPAATEAAAYALRRPQLSVGLHVDLAEWAVREGTWRPLYERVPVDDADAVAIEVERQHAIFRRLLGREPTHLDAHQHAHLEEPLATIMLELSQRLGVPLRHFSPAVRYCGNFYGQGKDGTALTAAITVEGLIATLRRLPPGVTELACHPAVDVDVDSMYREERAVEVRTLCDARVRSTLAECGIELRSFAQVDAGAP